MRRALVVLLAATIEGLIASPLSVSAATPSFKLILTSAQTAIPVGGGPIAFTLWNYGSEPASITVTTGASWATAAPSAFLVDAGAHQDVLVSVTPGTHGKTVVSFAAAAATVGTVRVIRALAAPIYIGVAPPRPKPATVTSPREIPLGAALGGGLCLLGLVVLLRLLWRRQWR